MSVWTTVLAHLTEYYGRASQPHGESLLERAILVVARTRSNTAAEKFRQSLRDADALDINALAGISPQELNSILPRGTAAGTARRLHDFAQLVVQHYESSLEQLFSTDVEELRTALRCVNGLGPETIETLLLAAGNIPVLPVTAALHRVAKRHGWIDLDADSESITAELGSGLFETAEPCWQLHALVERVGKDYCGKQPLCDACPLASLLPESGIVSAWD